MSLQQTSMELSTLAAVLAGLGTLVLAAGIIKLE